MKYLIKYSAYTDTGNGFSVCDFEKIEDDLESLCKQIASLEDHYKTDRNFKYCIYELQECNSEIVTSNKIYLNLKKKLEQENIIRRLKESMGYKRTQISDHEHHKEKYGKWENYDDQINLLKQELDMLGNKLKEQELTND